MRQLLSLILLVSLLAACTPAAEPTPTASVTPLPTRTSQPTITPFSFGATPQQQPAQPVQVTSAFPATAVIPPTFVAPTAIPSPLPPNYTPQPSLLQGGRGLTNGAVMYNGEFQVESYCQILNPNYTISEDGTRWYCNENWERRVVLGTQEFDDICIRTYNNPGAFAMQIAGSEPAAYRWRCFGY